MERMTSMNTRKKHEFKQEDAWNTPPHVWEDIAHLIPKNKIIWEAFMLDNWGSTSIKTLQGLGLSVVGNPTMNFFVGENFDYDMIISNPPYSCKLKIFKKLAIIDKPFILLLPVSVITKQFVKVLERDKLQLIIPKVRIHFEKNGEHSKRSWFDVVYLCYKMNLPDDITYL